MKKFDLESRKNLVVLVQLLLAAFGPILTYVGLKWSDVTSWNVLFDLVWMAIQNPYVLGLIIVSVWQTLNNPTTPGLGDSKE